MSVIAHVAGLPLEELLVPLVPVVAVIGVAARLLIERVTRTVSRDADPDR